MDAVTAWNECRHRIIELATQPGAAEVHVPACPDWDVKGVVAHLAGIAVGVTTDASVSEVNSDEATADQVQARAGMTVDEIVEEWSACVPDYLARLKDPEAHGMSNIAVLLSVFDIAAHEHDIRAALDQPGHRDEFGVELGTKLMASGLKGKHANAGLPPLRVEVPGWRTYDVGFGEGEEPAVTLTTDRFTLFRSLSGRRTRDQVAALDWVGDERARDAWLDHWVTGVFTWPETEHES